MISAYRICKVEISVYYYANTNNKTRILFFWKQIKEKTVTKGFFMRKDMIVFAISKVFEIQKIKK